MAMKVLALGNKNVTRRVTCALQRSGIEIVCRPTIVEAINLLKTSKFDLALVDGYLDDVEAVCYRITWQCRVPVALVINGTALDWNILHSLDMDGFIPEESQNIDLEEHFRSIINRKVSQPANIRVLIIEDDEHTQEALRLSFQIYWPEARVSTAACGKDGVLMARKGAADVILLDLLLPDMNGKEVLRQIRSFSQKPVLIMTASHSQDEVIQCITAGANDFILKPFKQLELLSRVRQQIPQAAASQI